MYEMINGKAKRVKETLLKQIQTKKSKKKAIKNVKSLVSFGGKTISRKNENSSFNDKTSKKSVAIVPCNMPESLLTTQSSKYNHMLDFNANS